MVGAAPASVRGIAQLTDRFHLLDAKDLLKYGANRCSLGDRVAVAKLFLPLK